MFRVFPARWGAVFLTALALCIPAGAVGQSAPADTTVEWARFVIYQGDTLWVADPLEVLGSRVPGVQMPGILFTGTVGWVI